MKTYRGLIDIGCGRGPKACPQKYQNNIQADCLNCDLAAVAVVDFDRKPLAVLNRGQAPEEVKPENRSGGQNRNKGGLTDGL